MMVCEKNAEWKLAMSELNDYISGKNEWKPKHK